MKQIKIIPVLVGLCALLLAALIVFSVVSSGSDSYQVSEYLTLCDYKNLAVTVYSDGTARVTTPPSASSAAVSGGSSGETSSRETASQPDDFEQIMSDYATGEQSSDASGSASSASGENGGISQSLDDALWNYVLDNTVVKSYPQKQLNAAKKGFSDAVAKNASDAGVGLSSYAMTAYGMTDEQFAEYEDEYCKTVLKQRMVLKAIAEAEGITLTADDKQSGLDRYISEYSTASKTYTDEDVYAVFDGENGFHEQLMLEKIIAMIRGGAQITSQTSAADAQ